MGSKVENDRDHRNFARAFLTFEIADKFKHNLNHKKCRLLFKNHSTIHTHFLKFIIFQNSRFTFTKKIINLASFPVFLSNSVVNCTGKPYYQMFHFTYFLQDPFRTYFTGRWGRCVIFSEVSSFFALRCCPRRKTIRTCMSVWALFVH